MLGKTSIYPHHNLGHTKGYLNAAIQIGNHYQLNDESSFIVLTAACGSDTGYFRLTPRKQP